MSPKVGCICTETQSLASTRALRAALNQNSPLGGRSREWVQPARGVVFVLAHDEAKGIGIALQDLFQAAGIFHTQVSALGLSR
jgi:hypothetical protein